MMKQLYIFFALTVFAQVYAQTPTLTGYTADPVASIDADEAYTLISEWAGLLSPDLNVGPSAREEEIFRMLVSSEGGDIPIINYDPNMGIWASDGLGHMVYRLKHSKNLNFVVSALYKTDALLARRNDTITGVILPTTGKREHTWYMDASNDFDQDTRISYLNVGGITNRIAEFAQWILDHPELHAQIAPFNPTIPIDTSVGNTYLDRAVYYVQELKKNFDLFDEEGGYWKFNAAKNVGMYFNNTYDDLLSLNEYRDAHPEDVPIDQFFKVMGESQWTTTPYNRVFWFCDGYHRTAMALLKLDEIDGTDLYTPFYEKANDRITSLGNYLSTYAQKYHEPSPLNTNYTWPYGTNLDHSEKYEDNTHLHMDYEAFEYLIDQGVFTDSSMIHLASSIYSRYFSYDHHVVYRTMDRSVSRDPIFNFPAHGADPYRPRGPIFAQVIGKHGAIEQVQGFLHKSMELMDEGIREMQSPNIRQDKLERLDTRRTRWFVYPYEIHTLKNRYRSRIDSSASNQPPLIVEQEAISIMQDIDQGSFIVKVEASDPDPGQQLHYWISKGNVGGKFKINPSTGEITLNVDYPLNADLEDLYRLKVFVTDNGNPVMFDSTEVEIDITKTNSAPQVLPDQQYTASKNMRNGDHIARAKVSDLENDTIKGYFLSTANDFFRIDFNTGIISMNSSSLSTQPAGDEQILYVQAQDAGSPPIISAMQEIKITVKDPVVKISASTREGERPLNIDFSTTVLGTNDLSFYEWDFDNDGAIDTTGSAASYTYTKAGSYMATVFADNSEGIKHAERVLIRVNEAMPSSPSDLVLHYDFAGDDYTVHDISGNGNHGKILNINRDKNIWMSGVVNGGMSFRTGSELEIPKAVFNPIVPTKEISISFWMNDAELWFHPLFQAYDANGNETMSISSHLYADQMIFKIIGTDYEESVHYDLNSNADLIRHGWTHWVFVKDGNNSKLRIYVNGKQEAQAWAYKKRILQAEYVRLGALPDIGQDNMNFSIDEFRMYSRALSDE
ncbi:MAG: cadherin domain-containing protein, partial [Bacteroides sp.]|nr:cadherin domain-containing protein [Bacteroides sp.]